MGLLQSRLGLLSFGEAGNRRGHTGWGSAPFSSHGAATRGVYTVIIVESAHRHGFVQLGVLVIRLLSGLLGARSTARGSVRLGASKGGGRDADHRWGAGREVCGELLRYRRTLRASYSLSTPLQSAAATQVCDNSMFGALSADTQHSLWRGAFPRTHRRQRAMAACTRSRRVPPRAPFGITLHVLHAHAEIRTLSIILVASASTCCSVHTARLYSIKPYTRVRAAREVENVRGRSSSLLLQTRVRIVRARAVRGPTFKVALLLASFPGRNDALHPDRPERSGCSEADLLLLRSRPAAQKQTCRSAG